MPRYTIDDEFELDDYGDDDQWLGTGSFFRKPRRRTPWGVFVLLGILVIGLAAFAALVYVPQQQEQDSFCVGCHTASHTEYLQRSETSIAGSFAPDLASYHYQQIRNNGGELKCIDCHRGDNGVVHRAQTIGLSAWMTALWLSDRNDPRVEKTAISATIEITNADNTTRTVTLWPNLAPPPGLEQIAANYTFVITPSRRVTRTLGFPNFYAPALSNAGCVGCHQETLLVAGPDNHFHTALPATYTLWKSGAKLIPPPSLANNEGAILAITTAGLTAYDTTLQCSSCHQTHRATETSLYLDRESVVPQACVQCHREVNQGPLVVTLPEEP